MARSHHFGIVQNTSVIGADAALRDRWLSDRGLVDEIRHAMTTALTLPSSLGSIDVISGGSAVKLLDLRGMDLRNMQIGQIDLSYCCFDFSDFSGTVFEQTDLQFSSLAHAHMDRTRFLQVQGAPMSAQHASFKASQILESFLMHSDFEAVDFSNAQISRVRFTGSNLQNVEFVNTTIEDCEISDTLFSDNAVNRDLVAKHGFKGTPIWTPSEARRSIQVSIRRPAGPSWTAFPRHTKPEVVMIVDDSVTVRKTLERQLSRAGYQVLTAQDAVQAQRQMTVATPDVMIIDIEMPRINGLDLMRLLRKNDLYRQLPIIMMTSQMEKHNRDEALEAGATEFFPKSDGADKLGELIRTIVQKSIG